MNKILRREPPGTFWAIALLLLIWNAMGVAAYLRLATASAESLAEDYPAAEIAIIEATPIWATSAFAIAVFAGLAGAIALLARKVIARWLFILSLAGVIVQYVWTFGMSGLTGIVGAERMIMPIMVVILCIFEIWYSGFGTRRGWLR